MSGIVIPEGFKPTLLSYEEARVPQWERHYGFNGRYLPKNDTTCGGGINFAHHLGGKLSEGLWEDIVFRIKPATLEIYGGSTGKFEIPTISRSDAVIIYLNADDMVRDIEVFFGGR